MMSRIFILLLVFVSSALTVFPDDDKPNLALKPDPYIARPVEFPAFKKKILSNGMKIFLIEKNDQPIFAFRMLIGGGKTADGDKPGLTEIYSAIINNTAGDSISGKNAESLDYIGAKITAEAQNDHLTINGLALKKHLNEFLKILRKIAIEPKFSQKELSLASKLKNAENKSRFSNPGNLADRLGAIVAFGYEHPYSRIERQKDLDKINLDDLENFKNKYFVPGNASLMIVSDVPDTVLMPLIEKTFGGWQPGKMIEKDKHKVSPMPQGVHFVAKPAAGQSSILFIAKAQPINHIHYEKLNFISDIINMKLFETLRLQKAFSYFPFAYITPYKDANYIGYGAEVSAENTDSAIIAIKETIKMLANDFITEEEKERLIKLNIGKYYMSFEKTDDFATMIQDAAFFETNIDDIKNYQNRIESLALTSLKDIYRNYFTKDINLIVVGNPRIKEKLKKFGKIYEYDGELNSKTGEFARMETIELSPKEIIDKYINALGGKVALGNVRILTDSADMIMTMSNGDMKGSQIMIKAEGGRQFYRLKTDEIDQVIRVNKGNAQILVNGAAKKIKGDELGTFLFNAKMFKYSKLLEEGYECEVLGKKAGYILMKAIGRDRKKKIFYFNSDTYLLERIETESKAQNKPPLIEHFSDYIEVGGVLLPANSIIESEYYTQKINHSYRVNPVLDTEQLFAPVE